MNPQERDLLASLEASIRAHTQASTAFMAQLAGGIQNGLLETFTEQFPTTGWLTRDYHVAVGSIVVHNYSATGQVTVVAGAPASAAPIRGPGVTPVPINTFLIVPISGRQFTLYGTAGETVTWHAFTGLQPYGVAR